jgi:hypothetical protein
MHDAGDARATSHHGSSTSFVRVTNPWDSSDDEN